MLSEDIPQGGPPSGAGHAADEYVFRFNRCTAKISQRFAQLIEQAVATLPVKEACSDGDRAFPESRDGRQHA
jgi:hypothetical protein